MDVSVAGGVIAIAIAIFVIAASRSARKKNGDDSNN
jgi:hypothetical protein